MNIEEFDYDLPRSLIAQKPVHPKSSSKLLLTRNNKIVNFSELPNKLTDEHFLVFNDTKVLPAILEGNVSKSKVIITLHTKNNKGLWTAFAKPSKKINENDIIEFDNQLNAKVFSKNKRGLVLKFNIEHNQLIAYLIENGTLPIPPYIKTRSTKKKLAKYYQTIFAKNLGSFACPTAGLHFDKATLDHLKRKEIDTVNVTLHVGAGTFLPLEFSSIEKNILHKEKGIISKSAAKKINRAIQEGKKIVAVGTTVTRLLEDCYLKHRKIVAFKEDINLFIKPGFKFNVVDQLITNFHLPKSSLLILVSAFAGKENILKYYKIAIKNNMRFFSYGDAMLLIKNEI